MDDHKSLKSEDITFLVVFTVLVGDARDHVNAGLPQLCDMDH